MKMIQEKLNHKVKDFKRKTETLSPVNNYKILSFRPQLGQLVVSIYNGVQEIWQKKFSAHPDTKINSKSNCHDEGCGARARPCLIVNPQHCRVHHA